MFGHVCYPLVVNHQLYFFGFVWAVSVESFAKNPGKTIDYNFNIHLGNPYVSPQQALQLLHWKS